jgi:hypothetical protein
VRLLQQRTCWNQQSCCGSSQSGASPVLARRRRSPLTPRYPTTPMCDGTLLETFGAHRPRHRCLRRRRLEGRARPGCSRCSTTSAPAGSDPTSAIAGALGVTPWLEFPTDPLTGQPRDRTARLAELAALPDPRASSRCTSRGRRCPRADAARSHDHPRRSRRALVDVPAPAGNASPPHEGLGGSRAFDAWFDGWVGSTPTSTIVRSFWAHRNDPDLLCSMYEDMKADLAGAARTVCGVLGWSVDDDARPPVRSSCPPSAPCSAPSRAMKMGPGRKATGSSARVPSARTGRASAPTRSVGSSTEHGRSSSRSCTSSS